MFSVKRCRQLLPRDCDLSDQEIEALRDQIYLLSRVIIDQFLEERQTTAGECATNSISQVSSAGNFQAALQLVPEQERPLLEERASVMEFDGELSRDEAERSAVALTLPERRK
jgi:hypothetical protein